MIGKITLALSVFLASSVDASPFQTKLSQSHNNKHARRMSRVMNAATPIRRLDEEEEEAEIDISGYTLVFQKCQFVKSYDADLAEDEDADTVLAVNRFVIFRLCATDSDCSSGYGEYLVDMDTYLESAVEYAQEYQENMCNACDEACAYDDAADDGGRKLRFLEMDCDTCTEECEKIENMEDNGYVEASNYIECQQIYEADDDGDDTAYYAGAMCASSGEKIKIGVFLDEDCSQLDTSLSVEDYIENKLSHALLKSIYSETGVSCTAVNWDDENADDANADDADDAEAEIETNEMCQTLYEAAGKCESPYSFADSYVNYEGYENQAQQEELVCDFISTLASGRYDQSGEILLTGRSTTASGGTKSTAGQKFALTVFVLGTCGLAAFAASLHAQLTKGGSADLSGQGGAMA